MVCREACGPGCAGRRSRTGSPKKKEALRAAFINTVNIGVQGRVNFETLQSREHMKRGGLRFGLDLSDSVTLSIKPCSGGPEID